MSEHRPVPSGLEISRRIADCLEDIDPIQYNGSNRARRVRNVNDYLQGRNDMPLDELLDWAERAQGGEYAARVQALRRSIRDFQEQKALLGQPYTRQGSRTYPYRVWDANPERPLKIIDQQLFDRAAKDGFPPGFFRKSYFDRVTFYCLPQGADLNFSYFQDCSFIVCRIGGTTFDNASLNSCDFHTSDIDHTTFIGASLSYTHFRDSSLTWVSFQQARLNSCNTIDCVLRNVGFLNTVLDGCSYQQITADNTRYLHTARITQGGATAEECARNRAAVLQSLRPASAPQHGKQPGQRHSGR